jgi:hypothetical protein
MRGRLVTVAFAAAGAVAWISAGELRWKARRDRAVAHAEKRAAIERNNEAIVMMRTARAMIEEIVITGAWDT